MNQTWMPNNDEIMHNFAVIRYICFGNPISTMTKLCIISSSFPLSAIQYGIFRTEHPSSTALPFTPEAITVNMTCKPTSPTKGQSKTSVKAE